MAANVLLIDYDPRSIGRIRRLLQEAGLNTVLARDGLAGIEEFQRTLPDLTLIQDLIPRKHGFEVCRELKATEHGARAPIVLITSLRNGRRTELLDTGCDGHLVKPFEEDALLATIRRFLPEVETNLRPSSCSVAPSTEWAPAPHYDDEEIENWVCELADAAPSLPRRSRKRARKKKPRAQAKRKARAKATVAHA